MSSGQVMADTLRKIGASLLAFFVAQFFAEPRNALDRVLFDLVGLMVVTAVGLALWGLSVPSEQRAGGDFPFIAGLFVPNLVAIGSHGLILRAVQPRTPLAFGRVGTRG